MTDRQTHQPVSAERRALSDEALAARAQSGSMDDFVELHDRYQGRVFNFLCRRTAMRNDAEDLTQETFLRAWQNLGSYLPAMRFSTWLFTIAVRLGIDRHRARQTSDGVHEKLRLAAQVDSRSDGDDDVDSRERGGNLWSLARQVLSTDQHTALWLRYAEGLDIQEIATVMDRNPVATRVMLFRARELLAKRAGHDFGHAGEGESGVLVAAGAKQVSAMRGVS